VPQRGTEKHSQKKATKHKTKGEGFFAFLRLFVAEN